MVLIKSDVREDPPPGKCQFSQKIPVWVMVAYEKQLPTHKVRVFPFLLFPSTSSFLNIAVEIAYSILTSDVQLTILAGFFSHEENFKVSPVSNSQVLYIPLVELPCCTPYYTCITGSLYFGIFFSHFATHAPYLW